MDYDFLSVEDFLKLEDSGTLLEIGTYDGEDAAAFPLRGAGLSVDSD